MCLGVPGRIVGITGPRELATATVEVAGTRRETCLAYLPEAVVGDWVLMQTGFAVTLLDEASAHESLALFDELGVLDGVGRGLPGPDRA
ncbi:HypC/HybG/HupF family hydrogenase formation chaperone [soil metagenome]